MSPSSSRSDFTTSAKYSSTAGPDISGPAVEEYFAEVVKSDLEEDGDMDVFRKVRKDFDDKGITISDDELRQSMDQFLLQAKEEIIGKDNI